MLTCGCSVRSARGYSQLIILRYFKLALAKRTPCQLAAPRTSSQTWHAIDLMLFDCGSSDAHTAWSWCSRLCVLKPVTLCNKALMMGHCLQKAATCLSSGMAVSNPLLSIVYNFLASWSGIHIAQPHIGLGSCRRWARQLQRWPDSYHLLDANYLVDMCKAWLPSTVACTYSWGQEESSAEPSSFQAFISVLFGVSTVSGFNRSLLRDIILETFCHSIGV